MAEFDNAPAESQEPRVQELWAYLSRVVEGPHPKLAEFIVDHGIEDTVARIKSRRALPEWLERATQARYHHDQSRQDLDDAARLGYRLLTPGSPEWPEAKLQSFTALEPQTTADAAPTTLWVRGQSIAGLLGESVALVGTRAASAYGVQVAGHLAEELAASGVSVVSGGALGIDAAAHQGALRRGGATVVVAACGAGVDYPRAHQSLFDVICHTGAIVTEYPPGVRPARHRFLTRNRLVAALSDATVVVEAGWRSGARNTATWATRLYRPLGAIPGQVNAPASSGCHDLIRRQEAVLITSVENVLALYRTVGSIDEDGQLELDWAASAVQKLSKNELQVFDALDPREPQPVALIADRAGLTVALTTHLLLALQKNGIATRGQEGWQRTVV